MTTTTPEQRAAWLQELESLWRSETIDAAVECELIRKLDRWLTARFFDLMTLKGILLTCPDHQSEERDELRERILKGR